MLPEEKRFAADLLASPQIRNSEEPTIIAWETGNELEGAPAEWTSDITSYIKSLSSQQLTIDGSYGVQKAALDLDTVDI